MIDMNPVIYRLCDRPEWAGICQEWDDTAWPRLSEEMTDFFAEHYSEAAKTGRKDAPQTWVASINNQPVGMISLIDDDHPDYLHLRPWLASAFVVPAMRGKGVFKRLHDALIDYATNTSQVNEIHVYSHLNFTQFGWSILGQTYDPFAPDHQVTIFKRILNPTLRT